MSYRISCLTVLVLILLGLCACGGGSQPAASSAATTTSDPTLASIAVTSPLSSLALGTTLSLTATATYSDGTTKNITSLATWSSSNPTDATVSASGVVSPLAAAASVTITAAYGGQSGTATIAVTGGGGPTLTGVTVTSPSDSITVGSTVSLTATATYSDGTTSNVTSSATWTSSNPTAATVSAAGVVSPLAVAASVTITAAYGGQSGTVALAITGGASTLTSITVTSPSASVTIGTPISLTATANYSDGTTSNVTSSATWTSSNTTDATVSASGIVSPLAVAASVTITAAYGGQSGTVALAITSGGGTSTLTSVTVTSPSSSVTVGTAISLTATANYSDGSTGSVTSQAAWTSSNTADATVSTSGVVSPLAPVGSVTITATYEGLSGSVALAIAANSVTNAVPSSLFGMSAHSGVLTVGGDPWPTMPIYGLRLWDSDTNWGIMNPSEGVYDWTTLDNWITAAATHGDQLIYTFGATPTWASSDPKDATCDNNVGSCWPPDDLNSDGTGTDQHWIDFVTAIAQHAPSITYWEMWNTPHDTNQWNGTDAQLVRMVQDARTYILKYIPTAKIISPANGQLNYSYPSGNCVMPDLMGGYLATGLGQYIDILGFHTYYTTVPEDIVPVIQCYRSIMSTYNISSLPLWSTEGSWGTNTELTSSTKQAGFVARLYLLLWSNGVLRHYWYDWNDAYTGTLEVNGVTNSAGTAYAQVESWMTGRSMSTLCAETTSSGIWTCGFTGSNGYESQAVWYPGGTKNYTAPTQYIDYLDLSGNKHTISPGATVSLGAEPILLQNQ